MEAFEKWDKKLCKADCPIAEIKGMDCESCTLVRKLGWKAALKWVLKEMDKQEDSDLYLWREIANEFGR